MENYNKNREQINRIRHLRAKNFTQISNTAVYDSRISLKAKGLLLQLVGRPDDWLFYVSEICNHNTDGRDSVLTAIKELENYGYLKRIQLRDENGRFNGKIWIIDDEGKLNDLEPEVFEEIATPISTQNHEVYKARKSGVSTDYGFSVVGFPGNGFPDVGEPATTNTNNTNTNITNTYLEKEKEKEEEQNSSVKEAEVLEEEKAIADFQVLTGIDMSPQARKNTYLNWRKKGYSHQLITKAAEISVLKRANVTLEYINTVLEDWALKGITTPEEAEQHISRQKKIKQASRKKPRSKTYEYEEKEIYVPPDVLEKLQNKNQT